MSKYVLREFINELKMLITYLQLNIIKAYKIYRKFKIFITIILLPALFI